MSCSPPQAIIRVAVGGATVKRTRVDGEAASVAIGFHSVWVASIGQHRDWLLRMDARTLVVEARIPLAAQPVALRAAFGAIVKGCLALLYLSRRRSWKPQLFSG